MGVGERLRRLDDAVVGPSPSGRPPAPPWVVAVRVITGVWLQLFVLATLVRSRGWLLGALAAGPVVLPAVVAALRWEREHGPPGTGRRVVASALLLFIVGGSLVTAAALAPEPWARHHSHYAAGCHPASSDVTARITRTVRGGFHVERVVVFASRDAAVASALVSGTLDVGGLKVPLVRQPADYALTPGTLAANNDLARRMSPSLPPLIADGPIGSVFDQINSDRAAAETCAAAR